MALNQTSHTRPILPTYNQAVGIDLWEQSNLRLPQYKRGYLARFNPYGQRSFHRRFLCNDIHIGLFVVLSVFLTNCSGRAGLR